MCVNIWLKKSPNSPEMRRYCGEFYDTIATKTIKKAIWAL